MAKTRCCIVGGGMLGATLALRLAQAGHHVTLMEAAPYLGGLASAWQLGDVVWDRHYHVILRSDKRLLSLLSELGLDQELRWSVTRTVFFADDHLYPMNDTVDYLKFPVLGLIDKMRLAATILYASHWADGPALEGIGVSEWLIRLSGRRTYERLWRPLLRAKLGDNVKIASALFIWAVIQRLNSARETGMKREMFGYVSGGYHTILGRLAERLAEVGVRVELKRPVNGIASRGGALEVRTDHGAERFDQVIVTLPAPAAARICEGLPAEPKERLEKVPYQGIVCASALLDRPLTGAYLTYIADEEIPFTAVVEMTGLVDPAAFNGRTLVYLPRYVTRDDPFYDLDDVEIERRFVAGLRKMHPAFARDRILSFKISRVRHVLAVPGLHYSRQVPAFSSGVPGLHIVNSAQIVDGTLNVNETIKLAERALESISLDSVRDEPVTRPLELVG